MTRFRQRSPNNTGTISRTRTVENIRPKLKLTANSTNDCVWNEFSNIKSEMQPTVVIAVKTPRRTEGV